VIFIRKEMILQKEKLRQSITNLLVHLESEHFKGYDPYDGLKSPLMNLPWIRNQYSIRFIFQQMMKRSPVNLRPLVGIQKSVNPVTLGLCIQGLVSLRMAHPEEAGHYKSKCDELIKMLEKCSAKGFHGICWGYDFPWQSRHFSLDAYLPSVVATGIITNALFEYNKINPQQLLRDYCVNAAEFVLNDLNRIDETADSFCFSYTPYDRYAVYNANMKAVRILAQAYSLSPEPRFLESAQKAARFVTSRQLPDGSWYYGPGPKSRWVDSYHTGYVLDCLDDFIRHTGKHEYQSALEKGIEFFRVSFTEPEGQPKFYAQNKYPVDCTAAAQIILTLSRFGYQDQAGRTMRYMLDNFQHPDGGFFFRKYRTHTNRINYIRWSDAWMFAALTKFYEQITNCQSFK
jgi:hypothetical protein